MWENSDNDDDSDFIIESESENGSESSPHARWTNSNVEPENSSGSSPYARSSDSNFEAENDSDSRAHAKSSSGAGPYYSQAEKRAHHNALERKRRDHIKDSFTSLRDSVPALQGEKVASRAQILKKAAEYIQFMRRKNNAHQQDIDDLKRQNNVLETQIRLLEKAKNGDNLLEVAIGIKSEGSSHDTDSSDGEGTTRRVKKLKINSTNS